MEKYRKTIFMLKKTKPLALTPFDWNSFCAALQFHIQTHTHNPQPQRIIEIDIGINAINFIRFNQVNARRWFLFEYGIDRPPAAGWTGLSLCISPCHSLNYNGTLKSFGKLAPIEKSVAQLNEMRSIQAREWKVAL